MNAPLKNLFAAIFYHALLLVCFLAFGAYSQKVDLVGKVFNGSGAPQIGCVATLKSLNISDTTGSDGIYHLVASLNATKQPYTA